MEPKTLFWNSAAAASTATTVGIIFTCTCKYLYTYIFLKKNHLQIFQGFFGIFGDSFTPFIESFLYLQSILFYSSYFIILRHLWYK